MAPLYKSALFSKVQNCFCSNIAKSCRNIALVFLPRAGPKPAKKTETKPDGSRRVTKTKSRFVIGSPMNLHPDWSGFTVRFYASRASPNKDEFKHASTHCSRWRFSAFHVTILLVLHKHLSFCCDFDRLRLSERSESVTQEALKVSEGCLDRLMW